MNEARIRIAILLGLAVVALVRLAGFEPAPSYDEMVPPPPSTEAATVLAGLGPGDVLAGYDVERVSGPDDGTIVVELHRGEEGLRLFVSRRGSETSEAPATTERFEIRYGPPSPDSGRTAVGDVDAIEAATALGERIDAADAAVPSAM